MHADAALVEAIRDQAVPDSPLHGAANLLIMPSLDAANIAFNLLKAAADGLPVGPILLGMRKPIHVLVPSVTARGIVNLSALAVSAAQGKGGGQWRRVRGFAPETPPRGAAPWIPAKGAALVTHHLRVVGREGAAA